MKGLKNILLLITLLTIGTKTNAQPLITGIITDADTQLVTGQFVEVYTDTTGTPYPYYDTTTTGVDGSYTFVLPQNIPQGVIFKVKTTACIPHTSGGFLFPFTSIACNFIVCATNKYISGTVYKDTMAADTTLVYLIQRHWDTSNVLTVQKIDSQYIIYQTPFYNFKLPLGANDSYYVKAGVLPISTQYLNFLPAYHDQDLNWNSAEIIPNENTVADIVMPASNMMGGQGFISGTVLSAYTGDSLYKRILLLTTINDVPVGFRYSNTDGTFSFGGLNYGTYKLFGDALGKTNPPLVFNLDSNSLSLTQITFLEDSTSFAGNLWPLSVSNGLADVLKVYPNPVKDRLRLSGLDSIEGVKRVSLFNITGTKVYDSNTEESELEMNLSELAEGIYILNVCSPKGAYIYKIVK
ncbi:MAG TPA: T9SS type A sorting domain-containing protein [Flavipsychrobacter sp.]|nr:T9SS type A sorting domain-containing protein [Flavipsychrobacter sp.]